MFGKAVQIIGVILLIIGLLINVSWLRKQPAVLLYISNLLPGSILTLAGYLILRYPTQKWSVAGLGFLATLCGIAWALIANVGAATWVSFTTDITDASRYEEIRGSYGELAGHFPQSIPEAATRVRFYYLPKFMQGGSHLQLRYELPPSEIDLLLERYRPVAKQVQPDTESILNGQDQLRTTSFRNEENTGFAPLPPDFEVLILGAQPYKTDPVDWNHGYSYGIAISEQRREVIYWATYW